MPKRTRLDVSPNKREGGWTVKDGSAARGAYRTQKEALTAAVKVARSAGNAQVVIRKKDGTIQSERTYRSDPRRSKG